jgi:hypothetical protein
VRPAAAQVLLQQQPEALRDLTHNKRRRGQGW